MTRGLRAPGRVMTASEMLAAADAAELPIEASGILVVRWVLPLHLCPGINRYAEMSPRSRQGLKLEVAQRMFVQIHRRAKPLAGKAFLRAVRFSSRASDHDSAWTKVAVDRLLTKNKLGLGFLIDDGPKYLDISAACAPAKRGHGFCYFDLWER